MEMQATKSATYYRGYEAKAAEISCAGWEAARDTFNAAYPPGQLWTGSVDGLEYAHGEYAALCEKMP